MSGSKHRIGKQLAHALTTTLGVSGFERWIGMPLARALSVSGSKHRIGTHLAHVLTGTLSFSSSKHRIGTHLAHALSAAGSNRRIGTYLAQVLSLSGSNRRIGTHLAHALDVSGFEGWITPYSIDGTLIHAAVLCLLAHPFNCVTQLVLTRIHPHQQPMGYEVFARRQIREISFGVSAADALWRDVVTVQPWRFFACCAALANVCVNGVVVHVAPG